MIYASDLDQTLIYSRKSFRLQEDILLPSIRLIETLDGKEISYMTENAIAKLGRIHKHHLFVPVTTRTIEQFRRISLFHHEIRPQYAVTSNGGNILVDGEQDDAWKNHILHKLKYEALGLHDLLSRFNELRHDSWILTEKCADELFYYFVVERSLMPEEEMKSFTRWANTQGWNVSIQGRKCYFVPQSVNKGDAVAYISEREGRSYVIASGDSLLDLSLLQQATYAVAPPHGELYHDNATAHLPSGQFAFTKEVGILSSEEILDIVLDRMKICCET